MTEAKQKYVDFHMHTYYSDGIDSPANLVRTAAMAGLDYMAISDHDNSKSYEEAKIEADKWKIGLVSGAEVSTNRFHILGLGFDVRETRSFSEHPENPSQTQSFLDIKNTGFQEFLKHSRGLQRDNCARRIDVLKQQGVPISIEKVEAFCPDSRLGKYNIVMTMLVDEECRNYFKKVHGRYLNHTEIFDNYLARETEAGKLRSVNVSPEEAIKAIHKANGIAILAHPFEDIRDPKDMGELDRLVSLGIDGLEIQLNFNGRNEPFKKYALEHNLLISYGSDYHGASFGRAFSSRGENVLSENLARALNLEV